MTLRDLLVRLHGKCEYPVLHGSPEQTWRELVKGSYPDPAMGEALAAVVEWCQLDDLASPVHRADAINALGPLRLRHMGDRGGSGDGLRVVQALVAAVDAAFDDEALDMQGGLQS
ncbi:MAG TPA: hypothetical protein VKA76_10295 [Gammaproteobacteria bacterium]|nr:hypothetical protein [Gammaproteobacteria bacterium]